MKKIILAILIGSTLIFTGCFGINKENQNDKASLSEENRDNYEVYKNSIDATNSKDRNSHSHDSDEDESKESTGDVDNKDIIIDKEKRSEAKRETDVEKEKNAKITADEALNLVKSKIKLKEEEVLILAQKGNIFKSEYNGRDCYIVLKERILDDDGESEIVAEYEVDIETSKIVMREKN